MLRWMIGRNGSQRTAQSLYDAIVAQSRLPVFYRDHCVPDTVTGRFEMIVLHMFLVLERLQAEPGDAAEPAQRLAQALNEAFMANLDDAMREMGVADVRVGQRMHQAAGAFFGRLMAYRKAITAPEAGSPDPLAAAIARNILVEVSDGAAVAARALALYTRTAATGLERQPGTDLMAGMVRFPTPAAAARP